MSKDKTTAEDNQDWDFVLDAPEVPRHRIKSNFDRGYNMGYRAGQEVMKAKCLKPPKEPVFYDFEDDYIHGYRAGIEHYKTRIQALSTEDC